MKTLKWISVFFLLAVAASGEALADRHRHVHFGVVLGPVWGPWHYPPPPYYVYPPYYYPPVVVERPAPTIYIEQPAPPAVAAPAPPAPVNYWYYCAAAKGYYPYVRECPSGWQKVLPQPPGQ